MTRLHTFLCLVAVPLMAGMAAYANVCMRDSEYVFDDSLALEQNKDVHSDRSTWWNVFTDDFWGKSIFEPSSNRSYRPLTVATFRLQQMLGLFGMPLLRSVNVGLHALNTLLVALVARYSLRLGRMSACIAAVLFGLHPIHVEAVANIVGRAELLSTAFALLSTLVVVRLVHCTRHDKPLQFVLWATIWFGCFVCGCLSKDSYVAVTAVHSVLALLLPLFLRSVPTMHLKPRYDIVCLCAAATLVYFSFRAWLLGGLLDLRESGLLRKEENPHLFIADRTERGVFLWYLICKNAVLLAWPWPLCAEYSYNCLPKIELWHDSRLLPMVFGSTVAIGVLFTLLVHALKSVWRATVAPLALVDPLKSGKVGLLQVCVCVAWVIFPFLPVSHLFVTVGTMLAERCLYVPSIGVCLLVGVWTNASSDYSPLRNENTRVFFCSALVVVASVFLSLCWTRNLDWMSNENLFASAVEVCPNSAKHHQQLALVRYNQFRYEEGVRLLRRAIAIDPDFCEARWHIARVMINQTRFDEGLDLLRQCCTCGTVAQNCLNAYKMVRGIVNPKKLSQGDELFDTAEVLSGEPTIAASLYRQSGLALLQEKRQCRAYRAFARSIQLRRNASQLGALLSNSEDSLCNTYYWTTASGRECRLAQKNEDMKRRLWREIVEHAWLATTQHCTLPWSDLPKTEVEQKEVQQRPLALKNIAMEMVRMVTQERESGNAWAEDSSAGAALMKKLFHIALTPLCDVFTARQFSADSDARPLRATPSTQERLAMALQGAVLADSDVQRTFYPVALQIAARIAMRETTPTTDDPRSTAEAIIQRIDTVLNELGDAQQCPAAEMALRVLQCDVAQFVSGEALPKKVRQYYHRQACDRVACPTTAEKCSGHRQVAGG